METANLFKKLACAWLTLLLVFVSSCIDKKDLYNTNWERPHIDFTFDTDGEYTVDVAYRNMGVETAVYFEIYDQNPVSEGENGTLVKREGVLPLYGGSTALDGTFHGSLKLPGYLKDVYVYTPAFYARTVIKATVNGKSIVAEDAGAETGRAFSRAGSGFNTYTSQTLNGKVIAGEKWKTYLGEFDGSTGRVDGFDEPGAEVTSYVVERVSRETYSLYYFWWNYYYNDPETGGWIKVDKFYDEQGNDDKNGSYYDRKIAKTATGESIYHSGYNYQGTDLRITDYQELYAAHAAVINAKVSCPDVYRSSEDMLVGKDAEVAITLLGGNTCWNSSLGYYWYPDGQKPSSYDEIKNKVVMLFPNTQDGHWGVDPSASKECIGVERGTCVQLKYYPDINDPATGTVTFPAGTRIGFVLATNAWTHRISGYDYTPTDKRYRAATSSGLSQDDKSNPFNAPRTAIYKYGDHIMVSFEDHTYDQNFSDVVFALKANPIEAFSEIVEVTDTEITSHANKGMYCFEDIWPAEGDYDMNDVILSCSYSKTMPVTKTKTTDHEGNIISSEFSTPDKISREEYTMKTFQNFVTYTDGISCIVELPDNLQIGDVEAKYYIKKRNSAEFEEFLPLGPLHQEEIYNKHGSLPYNQVNGGKYNIIHLVNNIRDFLGEGGVGAEFKIELIYKEGAYPTKESVFKPFICVRVPNRTDYFEVHLPWEAPTNVMPKTGWWSANADASRPDVVVDGKGSFYLRANNLANNVYGPWFPFAIYLSGATEADLAPLLNKDNEAVPINKLYPYYEEWVNSFNAEHTDWYKTSR